MVIGIVGVAAASGTMAYFSDEETSEDNVFTAGAVDLTVGWNESYNHEDESVQDVSLTDLDGEPIFDLGDVKPGDRGEATLHLDIDDNPAWLSMRGNVTENAENTCTEPEEAVDDSCADPGHWDGELAENVNVKLWYDDADGDGATPGDNEHQDGERIIFGGEGEVCEEVGGKLDVALVLDRSGSMDGDRITEAKEGSKNLVDSLGSSDQSAVVSFANDETLDQELTFNKTEAKNAIDSISAGGGTDMEDGVTAAHTELVNGTNARQDATKVMVILGDGDVNAEEEAQAAKDDGIRVITISLAGADEEMEDMASSEDDAHVADTADDLEGVFDDISGTICETQAGTLADLGDHIENGELLDGAESDGDGDPEAYSPGTSYIGFEWWVDGDVGNEIQTDSAAFDLQFYAEQRRHNDNPQNPWTDTGFGYGN